MTPDTRQNDGCSRLLIQPSCTDILMLEDHGEHLVCFKLKVAEWAPLAGVRLQARKDTVAQIQVLVLGGLAVLAMPV